MKLLVTNLDALNIIVNPNVDTVTPAELAEALEKNTENIMEEALEKVL